MTESTKIQNGNEGDADDRVNEAPSPNTPNGNGSDLEVKLADEKNRYLYLAADFENFRKRTQGERSQLLRYGAENLARDMIPVLDNLERAAEHRSPENFKALLDGIDLVLKQFKQSLSQHGVRPMESVGKPFDPHHHEAVGQVPSDKPEGTVVTEQLKGYALHDRLLRPAQVLVSKSTKEV